jgi:dUTP pyrophosphatase
MSAGFDIPARQVGAVLAGQTQAIKTGLYLKSPSWFWRFLSRWFVFELQVRSRSGLALKGITVANSPATIDADYPQEIKVLLHNSTQADFEYKPGDRIAQGVVCLAFRARGVVIQKVERTGGLGSTGK